MFVIDDITELKICRPLGATIPNSLFYVRSTWHVLLIQFIPMDIFSDEKSPMESTQFLSMICKKLFLFHIILRRFYPRTFYVCCETLQWTQSFMILFWLIRIRARPRIFFPTWEFYVCRYTHDVSSISNKTEMRKTNKSNEAIQYTKKSRPFKIELYHVSSPAQLTWGSEN